MVARSIPRDARCVAMLLSLLAGVVGASYGAEGSLSMSFGPALENASKPLPPYDPDGLRVVYSVVLSTPMANALRSFDGSFVVWKQADYRPKELRSYPFSLQSTPSGIVGDFNGDGRPDAVLAGRNARGAAVLALLSGDSSAYSIAPISQFDFNKLREQGLAVPTVAPDILFFQPKGKVYELGDMYIKKLILEYDAFEIAVIDTYDKNLRSYYPSLHWWDGKKFLLSGLVDPTR